MGWGLQELSLFMQYKNAAPVESEYCLLTATYHGKCHYWGLAPSSEASCIRCCAQRVGLKVVSSLTMDPFLISCEFSVLWLKLIIKGQEMKTFVWLSLSSLGHEMSWVFSNYILGSAVLLSEDIFASFDLYPNWNVLYVLFFLSVRFDISGKPDRFCVPSSSCGFLILFVCWQNRIEYVYTKQEGRTKLKCVGD